MPTLRGIAGERRQFRTSESLSILKASPESAVGSGLARLCTGDTVRLNLNARIFNAEVDPAEWKTLTQCLDTLNGSISNPMAGDISKQCCPVS
jgi:dihydroxyacid dehydratase/phosphogluconate dehydratase